MRPWNIQCTVGKVFPYHAYICTSTVFTWHLSFTKRFVLFSTVIILCRIILVVPFKGIRIAIALYLRFKLHIILNTEPFVLCFDIFFSISALKSRIRSGLINDCNESNVNGKICKILTLCLPVWLHQWRKYSLLIKYVNIIS